MIPGIHDKYFLSKYLLLLHSRKYLIAQSTCLRWGYRVIDKQYYNYFIHYHHKNCLYFLQKGRIVLSDSVSFHIVFATWKKMHGNSICIIFKITHISVFKKYWGTRALKQWTSVTSSFYLLTAAAADRW